MSLNDKIIYSVTDKIMNLEEYYSIEDDGNLLTYIKTNNIISLKEITLNTLRVNFEVDKKPKEVLIEKEILNKIYAIYKIYSENNKFINIITQRTEKFDTNDILKKINELRIFRSVLRYKLNIDEYPVKTYYLEEKLKNKDNNNIEDIGKEFMLKKINNSPNNNNQKNYLNNNKKFLNSDKTTMVVNKKTNPNAFNINNHSVNLLGREAYDDNHSYLNNNLNNEAQNNNNNQANNYNKKLLEIQHDQNFINEINRIKAELEKYKIENIKLKNDLVKANKIIESLQKNQKENSNIKNLKEENKNLKNQLYIKENEINQMKLKLKNNNKNHHLFELDDIMVINFVATDSSIHEGIKCVKTDTFAEVEEKLYQIYDDLRKTNNMFTINGRTILRFKNLEENNIKDGDKAILMKIE